MDEECEYFQIICSNLIKFEEKVFFYFPFEDIDIMLFKLPRGLLQSGMSVGCTGYVQCRGCHFTASKLAGSLSENHA